jgi:hypothetical protein
MGGDAYGDRRVMRCRIPLRAVIAGLVPAISILEARPRQPDRGAHLIEITGTSPVMTV